MSERKLQPRCQAYALHTAKLEMLLAEMRDVRLQGSYGTLGGYERNR